MGVSPSRARPLGNFSLATVNGEVQRNFGNLAPGTYDVRERALAGWMPTGPDPVCSNGDNASSIQLTAGETVVCVFVNLKQDTIVVEKRPSAVTAPSTSTARSWAPSG